MQFDSYAQHHAPSRFSSRSTSRPVAPFQNDALALGEEVQGENPQLMFQTHSECFIPQLGAQLGRPPVLIQSDSRDFGCELTSECRLARGWKPTDQYEPRPGRCERSSARSEVTEGRLRDSGRSAGAVPPASGRGRSWGFPLDLVIHNASQRESEFTGMAERKWFSLSTSRSRVEK